MQPIPHFGDRIRPNSPKSSAEMLGFWILPKCSADLLGFCTLGLQWGNSGVAWQCMTCKCIMKWGPPFMFFMCVVQIDTMKCFYCLKKKCLWSPGICCPPPIKFFCGTSTLCVLVRVQFATSVFALHAPVRTSIGVLQAPHHQPPSQWILGCRCL